MSRVHTPNPALILNKVAMDSRAPILSRVTMAKQEVMGSRVVMVSKAAINRSSNSSSNLLPQATHRQLQHTAASPQVSMANRAVVMASRAVTVKITQAAKDHIVRSLTKVSLALKGATLEVQIPVVEVAACLKEVA